MAKKHTRTSLSASQASSPANLLQRAVQCHQQGKIDEAETLYKKVLAADSGNANALYLLGVIFIQRSQFEKSLSYIERSLEINPANVSAHYNLGLALQSLYMCDKAAIAYLSALQLDPKHLGSLTNLAAAYMYLEKYAQAEEVFRKLVGLNPQNIETLNNLGMCLFKRGQIEKALAYYEQAMALNAENPELNNNLGFALQSQGDFTGAREAYLRAVSGDPQYGGAWNNLGSLYWQTQAFSEANEAYKKGAECEKSAAVANTALAISHWLEQDLNSLNNTLQKIEGYPEIRYSANQNTFIQGYRGYLEALGSLAASKPELYREPGSAEALYVIGDSHCLSWHNLPVSIKENTYQAQAKLVVGCKAWFLVQSQANQYKENLSRVLETVPANAALAFVFGEIDCRLDEGIIPAARKAATDPIENAQSLAQAYVAELAALLEGHTGKAFVINVPRPQPAQMTVDEDVAQLHTVVSAFNQGLEAAVPQSDSLALLDVYSLSGEPQQPEPPYLLDGVHLNPSILQLDWR